MLNILLSILGIYRLYEEWLWYQVKNDIKPEHIAIILDGNRRWAYNHSLSSRAGHSQGADKTKQLLRWCFDLGVRTLTLYIFSTENFNRSKSEIKQLMSLFDEKFKEIIKNDDIHKNKVRIKVIGRLGLLPISLQQTIREMENATKMYDERFLNFAMAYGGRAEIVDAAKKMVQKVLTGGLSLNDIDENVFEENLYTSHLPKQEPDLIIRTSGEERLSGFLLYQSAYSELCFFDVYWPEFRRIDMLRAIRMYQKRLRRFGE